MTSPVNLDLVIDELGVEGLSQHEAHLLSAALERELGVRLREHLGAGVTGPLTLEELQIDLPMRDTPERMGAQIAQNFVSQMLGSMSQQAATTSALPPVQPVRPTAGGKPS